MAAVHACDAGDNGGCSQVCTKQGDVAVCSCNAGFQLQADRKSCDAGEYNLL